jgi:hypothetical protein
MYRDFEYIENDLEYRKQKSKKSWKRILINIRDVTIELVQLKIKTRKYMKIDFGVIVVLYTSALMF